MIDGRVARILAACMALTASSCATYKNAYSDRILGPQGVVGVEWEELCPGVALTRCVLKDPDLAVWCVRADLDTEGIRAGVIAAPAGGESSDSREARLSVAADLFRGARAGSPAATSSVIAAVNATPFNPVSLFAGVPCGIVGLSVTAGVVASPAAPRYGAIVFDKAGTGRIISGESTAALLLSGEVAEGAGGFSIILRDGAVTYSEFVGKYESGRAPRTAVGLSRDGRVLYLMVIDGKNPGHSVGATFGETALWIRTFGADSALMLDGGGSSAIAARFGGGSWRILNVPVQFFVPGVERPVANRIAVYARRTAVKDGRRN